MVIIFHTNKITAMASMAQYHLSGIKKGEGKW